MKQILAVHIEAGKLLAQYGLAQEGWTFELSGTQRMVGQCRHDDRVIEFSKHFLNSPPEQITDTLLHEIAHALVGKGYGHGGIWKAKAREIGANPYAVTENVITTAQYNYFMLCEKCNRRWYRYRMKQRNFGSVCPECHTPVKIYRIKK